MTMIFKEKFTKSACMRVFSLALCISLLFFIFSFIPFPVGAEGLTIDGHNCATINGYPIVGAQHMSNGSLLDVANHFNGCFTLFLVCKSRDNYYICNLPQFCFHGFSSDGSGLMFYYYKANSGGGDTGFAVADLEKDLTKMRFAILFDSSKGQYYIDWSSGNYISSYVDWSGKDCTSSIDLDNCSFYWAVNPNFVWTSSTCKMTIDNLISSSDGSGFVPSTTHSRARFNCFGNYSEVTYSEIESKYTIGHFKKKTVTDEKWGKPATKYYFSSSPSLASDFPDYASRYISFSYYNDTSDTDGITIRIDAIYGFTSKDIDDILDINSYICCTHTYIPCVALYSSSSMSSVPSNTTVYYKMDLANALNGLSRVYTYVLSIYQNSDNKLLTSTCINWRGETDEIFGCSSIGIDGNGIIESSVESSTKGDSIDDIILVPDDTGNMQDDLLIADDIQPENKIFGVDLNNFSVTDISGELVQASANASQFLQACYALFPPAIWTIVIAGISLIVLLRILGR